MPHRPAYYEVLSRADVEQKTVDEWKELTQTDDVEPRQEMTWKTALTFFRGFVVFHVIPLSIRYTWHRMWKFLRMWYLYPLQKKWALMDARIDAFLSNLAGNGFRFSRAMVSMRLHGRIGPGREMRYRLGLLRGKDVDHCLAFLSPRTLKTDATESTGFMKGDGTEADDGTTAVE